MASVRLRFYEPAFKAKFKNIIANDIRVRNFVDSFAKKIFVRSKDALLKEFNEHPITLELEGGIESTNISETLNNEGNLFTFLGFFSNQHPTEELRSLLQNINLKRTSIKNNVIYYSVSVPSKDVIASATEMVWSDKSWAYAVETGSFDGDAELSHFIWKSWEGSRSGGGFQVPNEYSEETFQPHPYITEILNNFRDRINGIIK